MWQMHDISIKGIVAGVICGVLAWPLLVCIGSFLLGAIIAFQDTEFSDDTFEKIIYPSILTIGMLIALLTGVTATHFSPTTTLMNAAISSGLLAIGYLILFVAADEPDPIFLRVFAALTLSVIPLSILGGWFTSYMKTN